MGGVSDGSKSESLPFLWFWDLSGAGGGLVWGGPGAAGPLEVSRIGGDQSLGPSRANDNN